MSESLALGIFIVGLAIGGLLTRMSMVGLIHRAKEKK
jgi:hypothetical protein